MKPMNNKLVVNEKLLVIASVCFLGCLALVCVMTTLIPKASPRTPPTIIIKNAGPCVFQDGKWLDVESFKVNDKKYICAEMETDQDETELSFSLYKVKELSWPLFIDNETFTQGKLTFLIDHHLDPGKYTVFISWARPALAEFNFEVAP